MTAKEQRNIDRLIESGTPENLSLAYHLMIGLGVDDVEAIWRIMAATNSNGTIFPAIGFNFYMVRFLWRSSPYITFDIYKAPFAPSDEIYCENVLYREYADTIDDYETEIRFHIDKTRHIWQDKI